jgi:Cu/Zn superoxide dismutase
MARFDRDGSILIVAVKTDDYLRQPSSDAGNCIACAIIERSSR